MICCPGHAGVGDVRIHYRYRGNEKFFDKPAESVIVGRPRHGVQVDIDLTPDLRVSRPHARISVAGGDYWIEDLGSANGTEVDGRPIKGAGIVRLEPGQRIQISDTTLTVDIPAGESRSEPSWASNDRTLVDTHDTRLDIAEMIDAAAPVFELGKSIDPDRAQALALLYELPLQFGEQTELDALFQTIIERLVGIIPAATRGALLLEDQANGELLLEADVRGFTKLTAGMDTDDVMDLLNDYFSALVDAIFKHDGTVDKITGDAILAVFGSPEPDPLRHEKAVRAALTMQSVMMEVSE